MTKRTHRGILLLSLAAALTGCGGDSSSIPTAPTAVQPPIAQPAPQPPPTGIQLAGTVSDAAWRRLSGAKVEVVSGPQSGLSTMTDGQGAYRLSGAFDETTRFRATKDGHAAVEWPLPAACEPCNPDWWIHFFLEALAPHPNLAGDYTLTFTANRTCAWVPNQARTLTYAATVTPQTAVDPASSSRFIVKVSGAAFLDHYDGFTIGLAGDYLAGFVGDVGHGGAGLVEEVAPNTYLSVAGDLSSVVTDTSTIAATLVGVVERCELPGVWGSRYGCGHGAVVTHERCSSNHELILKRR